MEGQGSAPTLKRSLNLTDLVLIGIGTILGTGGFNFIGEAVKDGGPMFPAALAIVSVLFQGASKVYDVAYRAFKTNTAESDAVESVFGPFASLLTSVSILGFNIFAVSTLLVKTASRIFPQGKWHGQVSLALMVLTTMTGVALKGIDVNKEFIGFFSSIIVVLLTLASGIGLFEGFLGGGPGPAAYPASLRSVPSFTKSVLFFYFIFSGFDDLIKFTEEAKNPDDDVPRSFYLSNAISTLLTVGVSYAFLHVLTLKKYGGTGGAPVPTENALGVILESALGPPVANIVEMLSHILIIATAFVSFLAVTRYMFSMAELHDKKDKTEETFMSGRLGWLQAVNENKAPWKAILAAFVLIAGGILLNHTEHLVQLTDSFLTFIMVSVSAAVSVMQWKKGKVPWIEGATTLGFAGIFFSCCWPF